MHVFLANLTVAVFALHSVLGCCWHHAHQCTEPCIANQEMTLSGECEHADHSEPAPDSQSHHGRYECQAATCVFVQSPNRDCCHLALSPDAPPVAFVPQAMPKSCGPDAGRPFFPADSLLPPLRWHLVCQVLLI